MECVKCNKHYDLLCLNLKKDGWKKMSQRVKDKWLCPSCSCSRPKTDNSATPARTTSATADEEQTDAFNVNTTRGSKVNPKSPSCAGAVDLVDIMHELSKLREEVGEIKILRKEVANLRTQVSSISTSLNETLLDFKKKLDSAEREISSLKCVVLQSQRELHRQEQDAISDELEVVGIREEENEDLSKIIITATGKLGVDLQITDLSRVSRVGPKHPPAAKAGPGPAPRPILVKLVRRIKRDEIVKASKQQKLTTEGISTGPPAPVYVNERLTQKNRLLFRDARLRSKKYNFRFCWVRNGAIYVRQGEHKPALRVQCYEDLDNNIGPADLPCAASST